MQSWEDPIGDDDEDENAYDKGFTYGRDAVIFLIDASSGMFEKHEDMEEIPFQLCLKCARSTLTNKIISSNKDLTGIVLFGTDKTKNTRNETDFKHIYVFQDLSEPGAERILETEELMSMDGPTFSSRYGHSKDFSLADAFWACGIMFSNCKYTLAHRRILLFTVHDDPHAGKQQLQILAKTKAKDLHDSSIDIDLFPIKKPGVTFDFSLFYKDIVYTPDDEQYKFTDPSEKFDDLLIRVRCKDHKKRPLGNIPFTIGEDVKMAFKMYKLVVPTPKPVPVKLTKEDNLEITLTRNTFLGDTGEVLLPSSIKKYQEYAGKKIYFSADEVKQIKYFYDPGLLLVGFKPKTCLKPHYHIKPSVFLYPDEKAIQGSTRLCYALVLQCSKRDYVPICRMISRQNEPPRFVALIPQLEHVDDHGNQTIPPGFHVIYLPYTEDIRCIKGEKKHNPSAAQVEKAKDIIKKLQFAYHPDSFENPVLQKHWRNIEALALNRDAPEEIVDYTLPTKDIIEKRAGKLIEEFKALLCPSATQSTSNYKRGPSTSQGGPPAKSARNEDLEVPSSFQEEAANGTLTRYKVNVLKEFCKRNGIRSGTKKADIIGEIVKFYQQQPSISLQQ